MTQEIESQVKNWSPLSVWSACVGVYASRRGRVCYYSGQPQWLIVAWACENRERLKPSFWCSAWVGNLNTKMHSIDSWPCKRFFNSLLFCFVLVYFFLSAAPSPFPFLKALPNKYFWIRGNGPDSHLFVWDFIPGKNRRDQVV